MSNPSLPTTPDLFADVAPMAPSASPDSPDSPDSPNSLLSSPAPAGPVDTATLLDALRAWSGQGWLRRLDSAFARFLHELSPHEAPAVFIAAALCAHMEGRGHACLLLDEVVRDANELLGWPTEGADALAAVLQGLPHAESQWLAALQASTLVFVDGGDPAQDRLQPLVLRGRRLYLRRYWAYEKRIASQVLARGAGAVTLEQTEVRKQLDLLFPPAQAGDERASPDWQKIACGIALRGRLSIITGGPGTGKTYTAARLLALLFAVDPDKDLRIALAAPTGKAAARLRQSIESALGELDAKLGDALNLAELASHIPPARTLHSLLGARPDTRKFRYDAARPLDVDVLIVDEASMVHLEMMAALLEALPPDARVIFLGDKDQLASVEAGAVLGDLCSQAEAGLYSPATLAWVRDVTGETIPPGLVGEGSPLAQQTVMLRESRRFGGPIGQLALAVNSGQAGLANSLLDQGKRETLRVDASSADAAVRLALRGRPDAGRGFSDYLDLLKARPADPSVHEAWAIDILKAFDRFRLLCAVREGEWGAAGLNQAVERALVHDGRLKKTGEWYEGRPVMVTRNDPAAGVFNGDIGIVLKTPARDDGTGAVHPGASSLRAWFLDGDSARSVSVSRLAHTETAFAMTVHKSQGSEFAHTVLVLPKEPSRVLTRELVYTGITRARENFTLVAGRSPAFAEAIGLKTRRAGGLLELLEGKGSEAGEPHA